MSKVISTTENLEYHNGLRQFVAMFKDLQRHAAEAGKLLCKLMDMSQGQALMDIKKLIPSAADDFLAQILKIGKGEMDPRTPFASEKVQPYLASKPIAVQKALLDGAAVPVVRKVMEDGELKLKTVPVPLAEFKGNEGKQALGTGDKAVPPAVQKQWIQAQHDCVLHRKTHAWIVKGDGVTIYGKDPWLSAAQLLAAYQAVAKNSIKSLPAAMIANQVKANSQGQVRYKK